MIVSERRRLRWRSPFQSNVSSIDHALGRADDAVGRGQEAAGQGAGIGIDEPGIGVEAMTLAGVERPVGLEVVQLAGLQAGDEDAPDVAPAIVFQD